VGRKLAILLMIAVLLSGCGVQENFVYPGPNPDPFAKATRKYTYYKNTFEMSETTSLAIMTAWALIYGCFCRFCNSEIFDPD